MKSEMNRRQVVGTLAASATLHWVGTAQAASHGPGTVRASAERVRPGAVIDLACVEADGFELVLDETAPKAYPAPNGTLRFRAPGFFTEGPWANIRCTPLKAGRPIGSAINVAVYVAFPGYGA